MKLLNVLIAAFLLSLSAGAMADHCDADTFTIEELELVNDLASNLDYSFEELCLNKRILDIQKENRRYFVRETNQAHTFKVITLHYNEYSCAYFFDATLGGWDKKRNKCYNTW